jgi:hypothetical protein
MTPQARWLALLAAERARRDPNRGEDARQRLLEDLKQMAQRFAATAHLYPVHVDDMSCAEMFACRLFLPKDMQPAGLPSEAAIWALYRARKQRAAIR